MERAEQTACLEELRERLARMETPRQHGQDSTVPSGCEALDQLLPEKGFRRGTLVEWLSGEGVGAGTLALLAAREACEKGGMVAVLDSPGEFCPTAAVRLGIAVERLLVVQPQNAADHDWAVDQVLRSPAVAAAVVWPRTTDVRTYRRWQLAAEQGGSLGLLLRPTAVRSEPSWADVRLLVEPLAGFMGGDSRRRLTESFGQSSTTGVASYSSTGRPLRITVLRCRGTAAGRSVDVELDDETYRVHPLERRQLQVAN